MKRRRPTVLQIPVELELKGLIEDAAAKTGLSQAGAMRAALRIGVPELVRGLEGKARPRRNFVEYLDAFAGLIRPNRDLVAPSRFR